MYATQIIHKTSSSCNINLNPQCTVAHTLPAVECTIGQTLINKMCYLLLVQCAAVLATLRCCQGPGTAERNFRRKFSDFWSERDFVPRPQGRRLLGHQGRGWERGMVPQRTEDGGRGRGMVRYVANLMPSLNPIPMIYILYTKAEAIGMGTGRHIS